MAATGRACHTVYLEFSSISMDVLGNEMPGAGGSFKICGKNPGKSCPSFFKFYFVFFVVQELVRVSRSFDPTQIRLTKVRLTKV